MSYNKFSALEKQRNASKEASISTSVGNYAALQIISFSVPPVIQRVPILEDVALVQAQHLVDDFFKSRAPGQGYKELMSQIKNDKQVRRYMGLPDIFGTGYEGLNKEAAKVYFEDCIRIYYGGSQVSQFDLSHVIPGGGLGSDKESMVLGSQLNEKGTDFAEDMVKFFPELKEVLKEAIYRPHELESYRQAKREKRKAEKKGNNKDKQGAENTDKIEKLQNVKEMTAQDNQERQLTNKGKSNKNTFKIRSFRFKATQNSNLNSIQQDVKQKKPLKLKVFDQALKDKFDPLFKNAIENAVEDLIKEAEKSKGFQLSFRRFGNPLSEDFNQPPHQSSTVADPSLESFGKVLKSNIKLGTEVAKLIFREQKSSKLHFGYAEGKKIGAFNSHFMNGQEEKMSVVDRLRWREGLRIVKGTEIPVGTNIPFPKSPQLKLFLKNHGLDCTKKFSIDKSTYITNSVEISSMGDVREKNIAELYSLGLQTCMDNQVKDVSINSAYKDKDAEIPQGLVIKRGTNIPILDKIEREIPLTTGRTIVHELAHQAESYLGVDKMIRLYRGLYARTIQGLNGLLEPGITQIGGANSSYYGLNLFLPDLGLSVNGLAKWEKDLNNQTNNSQKNKYPGVLMTYYKAKGSTTPYKHNLYGTEFLSTTAELLTKKEIAERLIETDPLRLALFLSIADPKLYHLIKRKFRKRVAKKGADIDLDQWLHVDQQCLIPVLEEQEIINE